MVMVPLRFVEYGNMLEEVQILGESVTMEEEVEFWRSVMQSAKDRGVEFYWFTWNVFLGAAEGKDGITQDRTAPRSIEYFRARGQGGWPWSRQRHADLLDQLDRAGVSAVGYDVLFEDPSPIDPLGDSTLDAMAEGGAGRFIFASTRLHPDYDAGASLHASMVPAAFPLTAEPRQNPPVAILEPASEFALADRQDVGSDLQVLAVLGQRRLS